jgi:hypothetical protein
LQANIASRSMAALNGSQRIRPSQYNRVTALHIR